MYRWLALVVSFLAIGLPELASADDLLKGFKGVRAITRTTADSRCIGDPKTPLCAVETLLGCWARQDPSLCKMVWDFSEVNEAEEMSYKYKFRSTKLLTLSDYGPKGRQDISQPGDVEILLDMIVCVNARCPFQYFDGNVWVLRNERGKWRVVYYSSEGGDDND